MGDDEYAEYDSLRRKLADEHPMRSVRTAAALRAAPTHALHETRCVLGIKSQAAQMVRTVLAKAKGKA